MVSAYFAVSLLFFSCWNHATVHSAIPDDTWSAVVSGCINGHNSQTIKDVPTLARCQLLCKDSFQCLSVDYKPSRRTCSFNLVDSRTAPVTKPCGSLQFSEPVRRLQDHWSTAETGCLFGRTLVRKPNVPTLNDCRALCEDNKDCLSVDYQPSRKVCRLNNADKDIEPILADCEGYKHSERIRPTLRWRSIDGFCIKGNTLIGLFRVDTLDECRHLCEKEDKCLSVDYSKSLSRCFMNEVGTSTNTVIKCAVPGYQFSEPSTEVPTEWTTPQPGCIYGYSGGIVKDVQTLGKCQLLCKDSFKCLSVDYQPLEKVCRFNMVDTRQRPITKSCNGNQFSEPIRRVEDHWSKAVFGCMFGRTIKRIPGVSTINDCRVLCEKNQRCLSVAYQPSRKVCRLNNVASGTQEIMTDCDGYKHSERIQPKLRWRTVGGFCIKGNTLRGLFRVDTLDECRQLCEQEVKCLSVDYSKSLSRCFMNEVGTSTNTIIKCAVSGYEFSEPSTEVPTNWSKPKKGCILGHTSGSVPDIQTLEKCRMLCRDSFQCLSIDYKPTQKICNFNRVDTRTARVTRSCSGGSSIFTEPLRRIEDHWSKSVLGCLFDRTIRRRANVRTMNDCRGLCEKNQRCLSVDYQPGRRVCRMNGVDSRSEEVWTDCEGYRHSEPIRPKQKWNSHEGFCIKGETLRGLFRIESLDECRQLCEQEAKCLSVDYSLSLARCFMNKVGTTTSSIIKCAVEGFQFSEPIRD